MASGIKGSKYVPTSVTPAIRDALIEASRLGRRPSKALLCVGYGPEVWRAWHGAVERGTASDFLVDLLRDMETAFQDGIRAALARIEEAGKAGSWQADAWKLERQNPEEFSRRTVVHVAASEDVNEFARAVRDTVRGMDFCTRSSGRIKIEENGHNNGHGGEE